MVTGLPLHQFGKNYSCHNVNLHCTSLWRFWDRDSDWTIDFDLWHEL